MTFTQVANDSTQNARQPLHVEAHVLRFHLADASEHRRLDIADASEHRRRDRECLADLTLSRATRAPDDFDLHERQIMV